MTARIIDGNALAKVTRARVRARISDLMTQGQRPPFLAVLLVGDNPASHIYVGRKEKACKDVGIQTKTWRLPASSTQAEVVALIEKLNADPSVDAILPQLPMPPQISRIDTIHAISPAKDVDGLTPYNQGLLDWNLPGKYPCTPAGVMEILRAEGVKLSGALVAVLGRSILVGAPMANMLSHAGATTICMHSESRDTAALTRMAEVVIVATGARHLVKKEWIKPGAIVIDVGIHRDPDGTLTGDVDFDSVAPVASAITPVPGGVGPMTIAMLLVNCLKAYEEKLV